MSIEYDMSKFPRSRGAQCGVLLDRKDIHTDSINASRKAVALAPAEYRYREALARRLMQNEEYDAALSEYAEALKLAPTEFFAEQVNDQQIENYRRQGVLTEKIEKTKATPKNFNQQKQLAKMYLKLGNITGTLEALIQARRLQPDDVPVNRRLASFYAKQKLWDDALAAYGHLIKIDSANAREYYMYIAHIQEQKRNFNAAIQAAKQVISFNPRKPDGHRLLASIEKQWRNYLSAIDSLERAVRLRPDITEIRTELAHAYNLAGKYRQAIEQYWQCWILTDNLNDRLSLVEQMAKVYNNLVTGDELREKLRRMQRSKPDDLGPSMALAKLHQLRGYLLAASEELERALERGAEDPDLLGQLVEINYELNNMPKAIAYQQWIVEIQPQPIHQLRLAELFFEVGQEQQARQVWLELMRDRNQTVGIDIGLASLLIRHGLQDEARFLMNRAGDNVQGVERRYQIGALLAKMGEFEAATRQFERIMTMSEPCQSDAENTARTGDDSVLQYPSWLQDDTWRFHRPTQFKHDIQRMEGNSNSLPSLPNSFTDAQDGALAHLVLIAKMTHRLADFLARLELKVESNPTNLKVLETLVKVHILVENRHEAARTMNRLITLSPNDYVYRAVQIYHALPPNLDFQTAQTYLKGFTQCSVETHLWYASRLAQHLQYTENRDSAKRLILETVLPIKDLNSLVTDKAAISQILTILTQLGETTTVEMLLSQLAAERQNPTTGLEESQKQWYRQHSFSLLSGAYLNLGPTDQAIADFWQWLEHARPNTGSAYITPLNFYGNRRHRPYYFPKSSVRTANNYIHGIGIHSLQTVFMYHWAKDQLEPLYAKLHAIFSRAEAEAKIYPGLALCYFYWWDELPEKSLEILGELQATFPDNFTLLFQTAMVSIETGKHQLAMSALTKLADKDGRNRQSHNYNALRLAIRTGNTVKVRELLLRMLNAPVNSELLFEIALELQQNGLTQYAIAAARRAMKLARRRHDPNLLKRASEQLEWIGSGQDAAIAAEQARRIITQHKRYGRAMYQQKFGGRPITETPHRPNAHREAKLRAVVEKTPTSFQAQMRLAAYYESTNQIDKAAEAFEAALSIRPQDSVTRKRYAQMLIRGGRPDAAVVQVTPLVEDNLRALGSIYYDVIHAFFDAGKVNEIVALAKKKIELSLGHSFNHDFANGVASVCLQKNQSRKAAEIYELLVSIQPHRIWDLISAHTTAGNLDTASQLLWNAVKSKDSSIVKDKRGYVQALYKLMELYKSKGQTGALRVKFEQRLRENPDDTVQAYFVTLLRLSTKETEDVQPLLDQLLEDASAMDLGWFLNLAGVYRAAGNREIEIRLLERAIKKLSENPANFPQLYELRQAYEDLGKAYAEHGNKQRARESFRKMTTLAMVRSGRAFYPSTADLYFQHEMRADAEALYTEILRDLFSRQYTQQQAQERLLKLREHMGESNMAPQCTEKMNSHVLRALANQYMKQGQLNKAEELFEQLAERVPEDLESRAKLAEIYSRQNNHDAALTEWKAILKSDPDTTKYQDGVVKAYQSAGKIDVAIQLAKEYAEAEKGGALRPPCQSLRVQQSR